MRCLMFAFVVVLSDLGGLAQDAVQARHSRYMDRALVRHLDNSVTVTANAPRPLADAAIALSEEYGWVIDFEDPPYYSRYDLVDDTDSKWRAAHPTAKGATVIAGADFQSQFPENPNPSSWAAEARILDSVVSDYNASGNPGRFIVRDEGNGRFTIIGTVVKDENGQVQSLNPILDTPISIPTETRDAETTIYVILRALTAQSHTQVGGPATALNVLRQTRVTVGGENIPARELLLQTVSAAKVKLYWHLYYDNDTKSYALNVLPLMKATYDSSGNRTTDFIRN